MAQLLAQVHKMPRAHRQEGHARYADYQALSKQHSKLQRTLPIIREELTAADQRVLDFQHVRP